MVDVRQPSDEWLAQAVLGNYAERPRAENLERLRIWSYCDAQSYAPGETVRIHTCTNARTYSLHVIRDGLAQEMVLERKGLPGKLHHIPEDCSVNGCSWPVAFEFEIDDDWRSGAYIVRTKCLDGTKVADTHDHLFIVRPKSAKTLPGRLLLIAATSTWTAYNDWGGSNHYQGFTGPEGNLFSAQLSILRPFARGFISLPADVPRPTLMEPPGRMALPCYPHMEWAYANGFSKKYASAGWASYERHFARWAEAQGYQLDIIAQSDLHSRPEILPAYSCLAMVGHDEYWSWQMRDAIDAYVDRGGHVARFAGNFMWQIRLEQEDRIQICHKYLATRNDPYMTSGPRHLVTESWEAREIGRPGALTFGLNATRGLYAGWSGCSPRGAKGFPVYRPEHWAFKDTGLYYGDVLGAQSVIFGYEVDGLDYEIRGGLPHVAPGELAPEGLEILALGLSSTIEEGPTIVPGKVFLGSEDAEYVASVLKGSSDVPAIEATKRGCGMIVNFRRGKGEVFHAGTCEWVAGLLRRDEMVMQVTRNVLDRYLRP
ncbi:N,N-dimethylformamidase beta subunit family domain-containing protein [Taklimakanibacter lacteus]|uniref:N,N-dimethylformamidase beta subunit family domain-containing protein n=1 Tax=Taklimakanibacter lacteus TaxID=2268456 RepID=UPI000E66465E